MFRSYGCECGLGTLSRSKSNTLLIPLEKKKGNNNDNIQSVLESKSSW
jgi:hypothetical protein